MTIGIVYGNKEYYKYRILQGLNTISIDNTLFLPIFNVMYTSAEINNTITTMYNDFEVRLFLISVAYLFYKFLKKKFS